MIDRSQKFTGCACGTCSNATKRDRLVRRVVIALLVGGGLVSGALMPPEAIVAAVSGGRG